MMSEIVKNSVIEDIIETNRICKELMGTPHYKKLGEAGMRLIVEKAKSMGMHPVEALNGGLYNVSGKIEMTGQSMLSMIRQAGHSVTKDPKSTATCVILHGKRKDTGDTWTASFGIDDAKKAGIYRNMWEKYPETMCTWRCVSMLGRFLFSDLLKGVYVEGEIDTQAFIGASETNLATDSASSSIDIEVKEVPVITEEQLKQLEFFLVDNQELKTNLLNLIRSRTGHEELKAMPVTLFKSSLARAKEQYEIKFIEESEVILEEGENA